MNIRDKIIKKIVDAIVSNEPESEIYLYGSQARGNTKELSDWDLLILLNAKTISFEMETKFMDDLYEIELELGEIISPMIYSKKDWAEKYSITSLYKNIQKDGIRIK